MPLAPTPIAIWCPLAMILFLTGDAVACRSLPSVGEDLGHHIEQGTL